MINGKKIPSSVHCVHGILFLSSQPIVVVSSGTVLLIALDMNRQINFKIKVIHNMISKRWIHFCMLSLSIRQHAIHCFSLICSVVLFLKGMAQKYYEYNGYKIIVFYMWHVYITSLFRSNAFNHMLSSNIVLRSCNHCCIVIIVITVVVVVSNLFGAIHNLFELSLFLSISFS